MARRKRGSPLRPLLLVAVLIALAAAAWINRHRIAGFLDHGARVGAAEIASTERPAAPREEARIRVTGKLEVTSPPHDRELGISAANAAMLWRKVEMYQWREHCAVDACSYDAAWSEQPIDSHAFRHAAGHENPPPRLKAARFAADGIKIGGYAVAADLVAGQVASVELPVRSADLPPNLAVSFSDAGGALYAGGDPAHPKVGEIRVSYRVVPLGNVEITGVRRGHILAAE